MNSLTIQEQIKSIKWNVIGGITLLLFIGILTRVMIALNAVNVHLLEEGLKITIFGL